MYSVDGMNNEFPDDDQYRAICGALKLAAGWRRMPTKLECREMWAAMCTVVRERAPRDYLFRTGYLFRHHPGTQWVFSEFRPRLGGHPLAEFIPLYTLDESGAQRREDTPQSSATKGQGEKV